jgi:hypothetical protein
MDTPMPLEVPTDPFADLAHTKKHAFLKALADCGKHTPACRMAGICHSNPAYWRHRDLHFAELERQAWDLWVTKVAAVARTARRHSMGRNASARGRGRVAPRI